MSRPYEVFNAIRNGELTLEQFENYLKCVESSVIAQEVLRNRNLDDRLKNATAVCKSYMDEFAKRGLIYHPVSENNDQQRFQVEIAKSIINAWIKPTD